jgi:hypothetical protein
MSTDLLAAANSDFFTAESLLTFGGASTATVIVGNTIRKVFKQDAVWIPFVVALLLAIAAAGAGGQLSKASGWLITVVNGCLLFCTASGIQETLVTAATATETGGGQQQSKRPVKWLMPWFRRKE